MKHSKDNLRETLVIEGTAILIVAGILYFFIKYIF